jgi:type VI secretion system protein ImpM
MSDLPGWHGKLPSLGDFASRRLPHEFVEAWDGWLAAGLAALKQGAPDAWLDGYLASPIWRFMLCPGVLPAPCGDRAWAGVLMPSVDRAGRYFPFTIIAPLPGLPTDDEGLAGLQRWLHALDDVAADALQDDWPVAQLEAELGRVRPLAAPRSAAARASTLLAPHAAVQSFDLVSAADVTAWIRSDALAIWQTAASGQAFWWCEPDAEPGRLVVTRGLPVKAAIGILLGAAGSARDGAAAPLTISVPGSG